MGGMDPMMMMLMMDDSSSSTSDLLPLMMMGGMGGQPGQAGAMNPMMMMLMMDSDPKTKKECDAKYKLDRAYKWTGSLVAKVTAIADIRAAVADMITNTANYPC